MSNKEVSEKKSLIKYAVICDHAFVSDNKKVNIIGIFDRVFVKKIENKHIFPQFFIVVKFLSLKKGDHIKVFITSPTSQVTQKPIFDKRIELSNGEGGGHGTILFKANLIEFDVAGTWQVMIEINGVKEIATEFEVTLVD